MNDASIGLSEFRSNDLSVPRSLTSAVLQKLRADILHCRLMPGQKLLLMPLAKELGVSLAAVREALSRLTAEGLVVAMDQRGFIVSPASISDLVDITEARIDIESAAIRRSISLGDDAWLETVRGAWADLEAVAYPASYEPSAEYDRWSKVHEHFHFALLSACGSAWLVRFRGLLFELSERYRRLSRLTGATGRDVTSEHRAIVEAVLDRDVDAATACIAVHYRKTAEILMSKAAPALSQSPVTENATLRAMKGIHL